ncbi:MAG: amidohydrolase family protein [Eubacteriales bacterium]|nr:amidohydrolase family protein [Eubacteriales bacterium]
MKEISCPIVDAHAHIFPVKIAEKATKAIGAFYDIPMQNPQGLAEQLAEVGAKAGICRFLVCSSATVPAQVGSINDFIHEACLRYPQFIGLGTLHPFMDDVDAEIDRIVELGLHGVKLHPDFQKFYIDDEKAIAMYRRLAQRHLPVLFHTGDARYEYSAPTRLRRVLDEVDGFVAIGAHFGGYNRWEEARKVLRHPNVYYDTSSSLFALPPDEAADILRDYGADRCMFGTDFPMWEPKGELERFMAMPLTQAEREQVFYKTFCKLFGVDADKLKD